MENYKLTINGKKQEVSAEPDMPLLWVLRDLLNMKGTKFGCGQALCGACTVHLDEVAVRSCSLPISEVKNGKITIEQMLNMMIFGIYQKAPTLNEIFTHNAVAWLGTGVKLVKYEDIVRNLKRLDTPEAETFFTDLLSVLGLTTLPEDWRERVKVGSDRKQSGTSRENLAGIELNIPDQLPDMQKQMVEYAAPGLRRLLGYF